MNNDHPDKRYTHLPLSTEKFCDKRCDESCCGFIEEELLDFSYRRRYETFSVEQRGKSKISLRLNDRYLSVKPSGIAAFDALSPQEDATFNVERLAKDQIALKSIYNKYLTSDKFGCFGRNKPTFSAYSRGRYEVWKVKCRNKRGKIRSYLLPQIRLNSLVIPEIFYKFNF